MRIKEKVSTLFNKFLTVLKCCRAEGTIAFIDNILYFIEGKTRIRITEHFSEKGKPIGNLIENAISNEAEAMPHCDSLKSDSVEKAS